MQKDSTKKKKNNAVWRDEQTDKRGKRMKEEREQSNRPGKKHA